MTSVDPDYYRKRQVVRQTFTDIWYNLFRFIRCGLILVGGIFAFLIWFQLALKNPFEVIVGHYGSNPTLWVAFVLAWLVAFILVIRWLRRRTP